MEVWGSIDAPPPKEQVPITVTWGREYTPPWASQAEATLENMAVAENGWTDVRLRLPTPQKQSAWVICRG